VLLSSIVQRASPTMILGADWMAFPLLERGSEFFVFASYEQVRYFGVPEVDKDQTLLAAAQWKGSLSPGWQAGVDLQYFFLHQILDASLTENDMGTVLAKGHNLALKPSVRWSLMPGRFVEFELKWSRQVYDEPLDDYWEGGPRLTLGVEYGHRSELTLSYQSDWRPYLDRPAVDLGGNALSGTTLETHQDIAEVVWRHHWDARRRWRTVTRAGAIWQRDNASGYHDYRRLIVSQQVRYACGDWEFRLQGRVWHQLYDNQTLGEEDPRLRDRTLASAEGSIERSVSRRLTLFASYRHERSLSNARLDEYKVNVLESGLRFEF
jgi:hypothetical protein